MIIVTVTVHMLGLKGLFRGVLQTLEVVAEPTAPLLSYEALLEAAPVEVDQEERLEQLAERAAAQEIVDAAKKDVSSIPIPLLGYISFWCCELSEQCACKEGCEFGSRLSPSCKSIRAANSAWSEVPAKNVPEGSLGVLNPGPCSLGRSSGQVA